MAVPDLAHYLNLDGSSGEADLAKKVADGEEGDKKGEPQQEEQQEQQPVIDEATILCASDERAQVVKEMAKRRHLPYVYFRAIFARGIWQEYTHHGELVTEKFLPFQPVWVTLGDYQNILAMRKIYYGRIQEHTDLQNHPLTFNHGRPMPPEDVKALKTPQIHLSLYYNDSEDYKYDDDDDPSTYEEATRRILKSLLNMARTVRRG